MSLEHTMTRVWQLTPVSQHSPPWLFNFAPSNLQTHTELRFGTRYIFLCGEIMFEGTARFIRQIQESRVLVDITLDDYGVISVLAVPKQYIPRYPGLSLSMSRRVHDQASRYGDSNINFWTPGAYLFFYFIYIIN